MYRLYYYLVNVSLLFCFHFINSYVENILLVFWSFDLNVTTGHKIEGNVMQFSVLLKKGSKQQFKAMDIPLESEFASNLFDKQKAAIKEREEMKRLVLSQEQRQEEEELLVRK